MCMRASQLLHVCVCVCVSPRPQVDVALQGLDPFAVGLAKRSTVSVPSPSGVKGSDASDPEALVRRSRGRGVKIGSGGGGTEKGFSK